MNNHTNIIAWGKHFLESKEYTIIGNPHTIVETPWSVVVRFSTSVGDFYLKQTPPDLFIEVDIIKAIKISRPSSPVPSIIALNDEYHCFMMNACGDYSLRTKFNGIIDPALLVEGIESYITILRLFERKTDALLDLGVPDWRIERLPNHYIELLEQREMLLDEGLTYDEIDNLKRLIPSIESTCKFLPKNKINETLVNADFNENNLIINQNTNQLSIIDWGESVISHPFFTIASHLRSLARRYKLETNGTMIEHIKQKCLSCWSDVASMNELENIYKKMLSLYPVFSALAIYRLQAATHHKSKEKQNWFIAGFLKILLENKDQS